MIGLSNTAKADNNKEDVYQCVIEHLFVIQNHEDSKFVELNNPVTLMESLTNLGFKNTSSLSSTILHQIDSQGGINVKSIKKKFVSDSGISVIVNKATSKKYSDYEVSLAFNTLADRDEFIKMVKDYGFRSWSDTDPDDFLQFEVDGFNSCLSIFVEGKKLDIYDVCD